MGQNHWSLITYKLMNKNKQNYMTSYLPEAGVDFLDFVEDISNKQYLVKIYQKIKVLNIFPKTDYLIT